MFFLSKLYLNCVIAKIGILQFLHWKKLKNILAFQTIPYPSNSPFTNISPVQWQGCCAGPCQLLYASQGTINLNLQLKIRFLPLNERTNQPNKQTKPTTHQPPPQKIQNPKPKQKSLQPFPQKWGNKITLLICFVSALIPLNNAVIS